MSGEFSNPQINDETENLVVDLPELLGISIGQWVPFMVSRERVVFEVTGHEGGKTFLIRIRDTGDE